MITVTISHNVAHDGEGRHTAMLPGGGPAGRGVRSAIAGIVGAAVAAWLRDHSEVPGLAAEAHAAARRARARRDLELLAMEITTAEEHLAGLRRKQDQLRAIAGGD